MIEQSHTFEFGQDQTNIYMGWVEDPNQQQIGWIGLRPKSKLFFCPETIETDKFHGNLIFHTKQSVDDFIAILEEMKKIM